MIWHTAKSNWFRFFFWNILTKIFNASIKVQGFLCFFLSVCISQKSLVSFILATSLFVLIFFFFGHQGLYFNSTWSWYSIQYCNNRRRKREREKRANPVESAVHFAHLFPSRRVRYIFRSKQPSNIYLTRD